MDTKKRYVMTIVSGLLLMGLGVLYQLLDMVNATIALAFINAGVILIVVAVLKYNRFGAGVTQDEMTRHVSMSALSYSWLLTFVMANMFFWVDYFEVFPITTGHMLGVLIFGMPLSVAVFKKMLMR